MSRFRETEQLLKDYYKFDVTIKHLKGELRILKKEEEMLEYEIKNLKIKLNSSLPAMNYDKPCIQCSGDGTSPAEAELIRQSDLREKQLEQARKKIFNLEEEIDRRQKNYDRVANALKSYESGHAKHDENVIEFIELVYRDGEKKEVIAKKFNLPRRTFFREKSRIVKNIEQYLF